MIELSKVLCNERGNIAKPKNVKKIFIKLTDKKEKN